jgi:hypothetical protein
VGGAVRAPGARLPFTSARRFASDRGCRGGARALPAVQGAKEMDLQLKDNAGVAAGLDGEARANLLRVGGPGAPPPAAALRVREMDLLVCDGAGLAMYSLQITPTTLGWEQRALSYPPPAELRSVREHPDWARRARGILATPAARVCRVRVGVVAAEARAVEELGELHDGEEGVYRLCEAAAARHLALGKAAAKAGRAFLADVERARRPSHVPLHRLQGALAEELAFGHSVDALCSRSERFSECAEQSKVVNLLCRRLGLLGHRDDKGHRRYARVAPCATAELLCEALDMAPEELGL